MFVSVNSDLQSFATKCLFVSLSTCACELVKMNMQKNNTVGIFPVKLCDIIISEMAHSDGRHMAPLLSTPRPIVLTIIAASEMRLTRDSRTSLQTFVPKLGPVSS